MIAQSFGTGQAMRLATLSSARSMGAVGSYAPSSRPSSSNCRAPASTSSGLSLTATASFSPWRAASRH